MGIRRGKVGRQAYSSSPADLGRAIEVQIPT